MFTELYAVAVGAAKIPTERIIFQRTGLVSSVTRYYMPHAAADRAKDHLRASRCPDKYSGRALNAPTVLKCPALKDLMAAKREEKTPRTTTCLQNTFKTNNLHFLELCNSVEASSTFPPSSSATCRI
ncbi:hypothetical protein Bbelb_280770 [Branchiostoma belcheri]|nr:hypothetical protein Bbelb_280770 [Branchiostoma belcheri]